MSGNTPTRVRRRVARVAEDVLAEAKAVSAVDVLVGLGWLATSNVDRWRQGRAPYLTIGLSVPETKAAEALAYLPVWARERGLEPSEVEYAARTRDRRPLRFSEARDPEVERAYRTHWLSPDLSAVEQQRITDKASKPADLVVISPRKSFTCVECGRTDGGLLVMEDAGPLCLGCADLGHLVFLPAGDTALTRRAKRGSGLSAVVVRFSSARKRYERQGILVEEPALAAAEEQCLADEDARLRRRERERERRAAQDVDLQAATAEAIRRLFPRCPAERAEEVARHATLRGSGRVGRSAVGRSVDAGAVLLAVTVSVRHQDTAYEELLMSGVPRAEARARVDDDVRRVLDAWR